MIVALSKDEAWAVSEARDLLARYLPPEADRSGFECLVMETLAGLVSEIRQPLVHAGSEAFMADFIADLVDGPLPPADERARAAVEGGRPAERIVGGS